jgi:quinoprotein glucose dehydrogenase
LRTIFTLCILALFSAPTDVIAQTGAPTAAAGDAERGRTIFEGKAACQTCHRIRTSGSRAAPDLSTIGSAMTAAALTKALVDPAAAMRPAIRSVRAVTREGKEVIGRRMNEDMYSVQLIDEGGELRSFSKSALREFSVLTTPRMPSYKETLTAAELADLVAYLLSLKS